MKAVISSWPSSEIRPEQLVDLVGDESRGIAQKLEARQDDVGDDGIHVFAELDDGVFQIDDPFALHQVIPAGQQEQQIAHDAENLLVDGLAEF